MECQTCMHRPGQHEFVTNEVQRIMCIFIVFLFTEKYAQHWCGLLTDSTGPFAACHYAVNPAVYHTVLCQTAFPFGNNRNRSCSRHVLCNVHIPTAILQYFLLSTRVSLCVVTLLYFNCQSWLQDPDLFADEKAAIYSWMVLHIRQNSVFKGMSNACLNISQLSPYQPGILLITTWNRQPIT